MSEEIKSHLWSGWPGAVCLACFAQDELEMCVADGCAFDDCGCVSGCEKCYGTGCVIRVCENHQNGPCPGVPIHHVNQPEIDKDGSVTPAYWAAVVKHMNEMEPLPPEADGPDPELPDLDP